MNARRRSSRTKNWPKNLYCKPDGYFWYRDPTTGKSKGLGRDRAEAFDAADAANAILAARKASDLVSWIQGARGKAFSEWATEYSAAYLENRKLAVNTLKQFQSMQRIISTAKFGKRAINEITTMEVAEYLKSVETERGPTTAVHVRRVLQDMFREAETRGLIDLGKNPVTVTRKAKHEVKRDRLSLEQFLAIREQAEPWLANAMNIALLSGQRREDVVEAEISHIKDGYWYLKQGKTGVKLRISTALHLEAIQMSLDDAIKQARHRKISSRYLICRATSYGRARAGAPIAPNAITAAFIVARDKAGIKPQEGKTPPTFHEIRSLSQRLFEKEYGAAFTQKLLGHKNPMMTARYADSRGTEWMDVVGPESAGPNQKHI